jgi:hypothetical protein
VNAKDLTRLALTVSVVKARVLEADAAVRERLSMMLDPGERVPGRIGDAKVGAATRTDPKPAARVTDGAAFRAWVKDNRPEEIVTVESVNAAFERSLLKVITDCGGLPDPDTGEVIDVPGVQVVTGVPQLRVVPDDGAEQVIAAALASEGLSLTDLLDSITRTEIES